MNWAPASYSANYFWNGSHISPTAEIVPKVMTALKEWNFTPSTVRDFSQGTGAARLRLESLDQQWVVSFLSNLFSVDKRSISLDELSVGAAVDFAKAALSITALTIKEIPLQSNRLALIGRYLLKDFEAKNSAAIADKLLGKSPFYNENPTFEWNWRRAASATWTINGRSEATNVVCQIKRYSGHQLLPQGAKPFDVIELEVDVNTKHENTEYRFGTGDIAAFHEYALAMQEKLTAELLTHIT